MFNPFPLFIRKEKKTGGIYIVRNNFVVCVCVCVLSESGSIPCKEIKIPKGNAYFIEKNEWEVV